MITPNAMHSPKIIEVYDESMPAQYFLGVHNFDETRGSAIFRNAFGELAIFNFSNASGNNVRILESCFEQLQIPSIPKLQLLSFISQSSYMLSEV